MIVTTLNRIRAHGPCADGWTKLLHGLGKTQADDEPLPFARIAEINGLDDALWCCQCEPQHKRTWQLFAVWCARQVQHLMTDPRSIAALDVAERHATGNATDEELAAAWAAARAASDASDARDAWAARAASDAAWAARAAWAAWDAWAAWAAARAASDARAAARDAWAARAASDAAWAAWAAQLTKFVEMVSAPS